MLHPSPVADPRQPATAAPLRPAGRKGGRASALARPRGRYKIHRPTMGSVVSKAANGVGSLVGNALAAPLKALFGASCEGVCSGTWDLPCFLENICISSLARLFVASFLVLAVLAVARLLCKLGMLKLAAKIVRDVAWRPFAACCRALGAACCLLCRKVRGTRRVYRGRRRRDLEMGEAGTSRGDTGSSWSSDGGSGTASSDDSGGRSWRKKSSSSSSVSVRERRKDRVRQSLRLKKVSSKVERSVTVRTSYGGGSGRRHRHSTGLRRADEVSSSLSLRVHGSPAPGRTHAHRRT
ncbi:hypothetical protein U9M48_034948 [Paspalum notatum var. saurae]|uniref:Uncharacterized protein n=1 Tax=Paspalum notatum var. saurae TaxID=547442 RepID=A0AAQ3UB06_PASNO